MSDTKEMKDCPFCAEKILAKAIKCKHCGSMLKDADASTNDVAESQTTPTPQPITSESSEGTNQVSSMINMPNPQDIRDEAVVSISTASASIKLNPELTLVNATMREIVQRYASQIIDKQIYFAPNIPAKKIKKAISSYADGISEEEVLLLIDNTVFGNASEGGMLTYDTFYAKASMEEPVRIPLVNIAEVAWIEDKANELLPSHLRINENKAFLETSWRSPSDKNTMASFSRMLLVAKEAIVQIPTETQPKFRKDLITIIKEHHSSFQPKKGLFGLFSGSELLLWVADDIPARELANAKDKYAQFNPADETPLLLVNKKAFGQVFTGLLITDKKVWYIVKQEGQMAMITASTKKGCLPWSSIGSISLGKECNSNGYIGHTFMINEEEIGLLRMGTCLEGSENMQNYLRRLFDKMTKSGFFPQELMIKCRKIKEKRLEAERHKEEAERQKEIDREEAIKSLIIGGASVIAKISDGLSSQSSNQTAVAPPCPRSPTGKHQYTTGSCCIHCGKSDGLVRL